MLLGFGVMAFPRFCARAIAPLGNERSKTATQQFRQKIADPVEQRLNEDLEQHHADDGERDHAC
jgi:hypothetical protein